VDRLRYDEYRAYVTQKIARADLALDGIRISYDSPISGISSSTTGVAALGFDLPPRARIVADADYSRNPDYRRDVRGMLTFTYQFDANFAGSPKPKDRAAPSLPPRTPLRF